MRERLDKMLVDRGLAETRAKALGLIMAGQVLVNGKAVTKAGTAVGADSAITIAPHSEFVGRGALKLEAAIEAFNVAVQDVTAIDVGSSTGGFTEVLLKHGAKKVYAVDVGHGQLHPRLLADPRVDNREGQSIRDLSGADLAPVSLVVVDLSFISVCLALEPIVSVLDHPADVVVLVKPQFEVGRSRLGKKGVVTDAGHRAEAILAVVSCADEAGLGVHGVLTSPVTGTHGNAEYLLWLRPGASGRMEPDAIASEVAALTGTRSRRP